MLNLLLPTTKTKRSTFAMTRKTKNSPTGTEGGANRRRAPNGVSVVETVVDILRNQIRSRNLAPGQRLIEKEISDSVGASRASVREAMGRLEAEGLVEIEHQKGARVRRLSVQDAEYINHVREALEGMAARLAARNINKSDFRQRLRGLEKEFAAENDGLPSTYLRYNEKFHNLIVEMSDNWRLERMVRQLQHTTFVMLGQVVSHKLAIERALKEHKNIVAAVLKGDAERAERTMRAHIRRTASDTAARIRASLK